MKDCFSFEGDVTGDGPFLLGGVDGLPMTEEGDDGEEGLRKGEPRGELNDNADRLNGDDWTMVLAHWHLPLTLLTMMLLRRPVSVCVRSRM